MRKKAVNLTLSDEIRTRAQAVMLQRGFSSFSAYVEQLIRDEYERQRTKDASNVAAFMAAQVEPLNSSPSPAFQAIFDAGVAAATAHAAQALPPAPIQPVTYSKPARSTPRTKPAPRKKH